MTSILDDLMGRLGGENLSQLSRSIGADESSTKGALDTALPLLLGALSKNASSQEGAEALSNALDRGHDGNVLDDLQGFFGSSDDADGRGILGHVLGGKRERVEMGVSKASGLDLGSVAKLLSKLAPLVMGMLGKKKRSGGLGAIDLGDLLGGERKTIEKKHKAGGLISGLLDQDGDGDVDVQDLVKGVFGKIF